MMLWMLSNLKVVARWLHISFLLFNRYHVQPDATNAKAYWVRLYLNLLQHFLNLLNIFFLFGYFVRNHFSDLERTVITISNHLFANLTFVLLQPEHVLKASFVQGVFTVSKYQACVHPHITVAALTTHCYYLLLHWKHFLIGHRQIFRQGDAVVRTTVFKSQKQLIVFGLDLSRLQLSHYPLIVIIVLSSIPSIPRGWLPVFVRSSSHNEVMLLVIFALEAKLTDFHLLFKGKCYIITGHMMHCSLASYIKVLLQQ